LPVSPASRDAARRLSATDLYREVAGEGDPVVLIHAGVCDSRMWDPQWATFPPVHRTLRYDIRGFGRSPLTSPLVENARDLIELLGEVEFERAALVGVSLGGRIALEVAIARPELISALVLVGAGLPSTASTEVEAFDAAEEQALERGDLDAAAEINVRMWADGPRRSAEEVDPRVRRLVHDMTRRSLELQLALPEAEEKALVPDVADRLSEIQAPTLVLVGEEDIDHMHRLADRFEREIPDTRRASIPNAAHIPSLERPAEFDALVLPFLAERP
jgi:3-oxoadipate enol-lactonase